MKTSAAKAKLRLMKNHIFSEAEMKGVEPRVATLDDLHEFLLHGRIQLRHIIQALDHFLMDHEHFHRMRMNHLERELLGAVITALAEEKEKLKLQ
jgi:hypothetical protein